MKSDLIVLGSGISVFALSMAKNDGYAYLLIKEFC